MVRRCERNLARDVWISKQQHSPNNAEISDDETQADSSRTMPEAVEKEELGGWAGSALIDKLLEPEKGEK